MTVLPHPARRQRPGARALHARQRWHTRHLALRFRSTPLALRPTPATLLGMPVVNPLQALKLGAIYRPRATLNAFGAVGQYAVYRFGALLVSACWARG